MRGITTIAMLLTLALAAGCDDGPSGIDGSVRSDSGMQSGCLVTPCTGGLMCCSGVPYPEEGVCMQTCDMRSDRDIKHGRASVDPEAVLEAVARLEVSEWSYDERPDVRHVGPMAQDFHAAFGVGADDRHIHPVDANGVTLLAIQALYRRVQALEEENRRLREAR